MAGRRDVPFEAFHTRAPAWLATMHVESPFHDPSPLTALLHEPGKEASLFRFDLWHAFHLGVGKAFVGGALALWSERFEGRGKDARFDKLSGHFRAWCSATGHPMILSKLSKESIGWENSTNYPVGTWFKGSLTTTLSEYIRDQLGGGDSGDEMLDLVGEAASAIHHCISGLYGSDAFVEAPKARELGEYGLRFLRRYSTLADKACAVSRPLFILLPKMHALQHVFLQDLVIASQTQEWIVNPVCYSVQQSEDFIGKNSRVSRRVHPAECARRVIQRHLKLAHNKYVEAGLLVPVGEG